MERKNVWILEDTKKYREELEKIVTSEGFNPISFEARNPFLRAYIKEENKENIYGMILDNRVPIYDEPGSFSEANMGVDVIYELSFRDLMEDINVALYTHDEMSSEIEEACNLGATYHNKDNGASWVRDFLNRK